VSVLGSVGMRGDDEGMPDSDPDHLDLSDLDLGGIDPDNVYVLHSHDNPETGATAFLPPGHARSASRWAAPNLSGTAGMSPITQPCPLPRSRRTGLRLT
jgi:hypothetical protein